MFFLIKFNKMNPPNEETSVSYIKGSFNQLFYLSIQLSISLLQKRGGFKIPLSNQLGEQKIL